MDPKPPVFKMIYQFNLDSRIAKDHFLRLVESAGMGPMLAHKVHIAVADGKARIATAATTTPVTDPGKPEDFIGIMKAEDIAMVSSGDYERYFEVNGVRYHHIIDPKTGHPSRSSKGTTVFLPSSTDADGLSTTLFVLGPDKSTDVLSKFPSVGVIFVLPNGDIVTKSIVDNFEFK